ncbi:GtrA family protein [Psychrobacillus sp. FSL K6-4615]|uniref:GtrA family protein n=1 Tax=Psychrobacillus sp. FSL K6-4615 TaxID=2921551 RepID=UPI0030F60D6D
MKQENVQDTLSMKFLNKEFFRFLIVGLVNTAATYILYLILLLFLNYNISYIISYLSGILIAFLLNAKYVFNVRLTVGKAVKYPVVYIFQYILNVFMLNALVENRILHETLAPLLVIIISLPITFFMSKFILKK